MDQNSKVFVAGHTGLVGSALVRRLHTLGYGNLVLRRHAELDLTDQLAVRNFFSEQQPEYVIVAAAKVGGILANNSLPAEFVHQNLLIATNVIHEAYRNRVQRLLFLGSSCVY
ncbi:MAG: NAD-dependent epimerase/dehydratase family protein, partial [Candidatus Acidiferrum sp.]